VSEQTHSTEDVTALLEQLGRITTVQKGEDREQLLTRLATVNAVARALSDLLDLPGGADGVAEVNWIQHQTGYLQGQADRLAGDWANT
jgi:hypothetical protein